jgi:hypothetical protein
MPVAMSGVPESLNATLILSGTELLFLLVLFPMIGSLGNSVISTLVHRSIDGNPTPPEPRCPVGADGNSDEDELLLKIGAWGVRPFD